MRLLLLLTVGLPVLAAQALVARVEVTPWVFQFSQKAEASEDGASRLPRVHAVVARANFVAAVLMQSGLEASTVEAPEGTSSRALTFVLQHRFQAV